MLLTKSLPALWTVLVGVLTLNADVFELIPLLPLSLFTALLVVFVAGLSQALSQSVVLFINRVRPSRFVLSLLITAILFGFNYGFWAISTWLVAAWEYGVKIGLRDFVQTIGFSYAPLIFGFLVILPYFGMPIFLILSIWSLLAMVVGIETITNLTRWQAFACCIGGWVMLQVSQRTIGYPIKTIERILLNRVAGVELVTDPFSVEQMLYEGLLISQTVKGSSSEVSSFVHNLGDRADESGSPMISPTSDTTSTLPKDP